MLPLLTHKEVKDKNFSKHSTFSYDIKSPPLAINTNIFKRIYVIQCT